MIYLDYSATTPVSFEVLDTFNRTTKDFIGNPNSLHKLGVKSLDLITSATKQIADICNVMPREIIYTYSATEANNLALIGVMLANHHQGKHLITSKLEHPSIYKICDYLTSIGFEVSYVDNDQDGLIDFDHLKKLVRDDTVLVSICSVNSETGVRQPLKMIRQIIKKENNNTLLHSDFTQAIGKVPVNFNDVDLASLSGHKFFCPKGIGMLYRNDKVKIKPLIYGSGKTNELHPGTPSVALIASFAKALRIALTDIEKRERFVTRLNEKLVKEFSIHKDIQINQTKYSIPHILNISLNNIKPETFIHALEEKDIYVGTNTACASGDLSTSVMAIYNDKKRATSTIRISISHLTTSDEINQFINVFNVVYQDLNNLTTKEG
ncbi:MAG: cysteine desulfurase [Bacilli bacterium]|nr:cysteine desulfurase [Bacilli bacterium]